MLITGVQLKIKEDVYVDARIVEHERLFSTLNDFCLAATPDNPVCTIMTNENDIEIKIYNNKTGYEGDLSDIRVIGLKHPAIIKYAEDDTAVNCNLPDYMHIDIVKHATDIWFKSISLTSNKQ